MLFREHRGGLEESVATMWEFYSRRQLIGHLQSMLKRWEVEIEDGDIEIRPYGAPDGVPDSRIGWAHTYVVFLTGYGVLGFTNGPVSSTMVG